MKIKINTDGTITALYSDANYETLKALFGDNIKPIEQIRQSDIILNEESGKLKIDLFNHPGVDLGDFEMGERDKAIEAEIEYLESIDLT